MLVTVQKYLKWFVVGICSLMCSKENHSDGKRMYVNVLPYSENKDGSLSLKCLLRSRLKKNKHVNHFGLEWMWKRVFFIFTVIFWGQCSEVWSLKVHSVVLPWPSSEKKSSFTRGEEHLSLDLVLLAVWGYFRGCFSKVILQSTQCTATLPLCSTHQLSRRTLKQTCPFGHIWGSLLCHFVMSNTVLSRTPCGNELETFPFPNDPARETITVDLQGTSKLDFHLDVCIKLSEQLECCRH